MRIPSNRIKIVMNMSSGETLTFGHEQENGSRLMRGRRDVERRIAIAESIGLHVVQLAVFTAEGHKFVVSACLD